MRGWWRRRRQWRGIKVSSVVHEEQHLRWLGQGPRGPSEDLVWMQTLSCVQRGNSEAGVRACARANPWI